MKTENSALPLISVIGGLLGLFMACSLAKAAPGRPSLLSVPPNYQGKPFEAVYRVGPQSLPGRIQCTCFDLGGEGIAYHSDGTNHGAHDQLRDLAEGKRPKATPYIWNFRTNEQVSISYTCGEHKDHCIKQDPAPFDPTTNQLYIGWTKDGQWLNYTVNVKEAGTYKVSVLYASDPTTFSFLINHEPACEFKLPLKTGSMHAWNQAEVGTITFPHTGLQLLTFQYNKGNNFACFDFDLVEKK